MYTSFDHTAKVKKERFAMPEDSSHNEKTYVLDAENAAEMARLIQQDLLITRHMGGLLPEQPDFANISRVLDVGCGPGGWVHEVAAAHPSLEAVGIDISTIMIQYARVQAGVRGLDNARFEVMDATKPLQFPANSFDLINARLIFAFMPLDGWPRLVQECLRLLRSGGLLRLTECEWCITNGEAFERLNGMGTRALKLAGRSFSPDGRQLGMSPMLGRFLLDAGFQRITIKGHAIDFSARMEAHDAYYQDYRVLFKLLQPFLVNMKVTTQEEVAWLYEQMLEEMRSDGFRGVAFLLTATGEKPR
jgi:ubiquinone/menaquinone biosynthesis C-methylase UbiE